MPFLKEILQILGLTEGLEFLRPICTAAWLAVIGIGLLLYVFQSLSLYTIAKRRCIRHAWLSWVPVGNLWILGSIADQYQYVVKGRVRNRRKVLLASSLSALVLGIALFAMFAAVMAEMSVAATDGAITGLWVGKMAMASGLLSMVMVIVSVWCLVYSCISYYDLFASCDPDTKVVFLVLGIVFEFTLPFFLFADRNRDYGMPPRTDGTYAEPAQSDT